MDHYIHFIIALNALHFHSVLLNCKINWFGKNVPVIYLTLVPRIIHIDPLIRKIFLFVWSTERVIVKVCERLYTTIQKSSVFNNIKPNSLNCAALQFKIQLILGSCKKINILEAFRVIRKLYNAENEIRKLTKRMHYVYVQVDSLFSLCILFLI